MSRTGAREGDGQILQILCGYNFVVGLNGLEICRQVGSILLSSWEMQ